MAAPGHLKRSATTSSTSPPRASWAASPPSATASTTGSVPPRPGHRLQPRGADAVLAAAAVAPGTGLAGGLGPGRRGAVPGAGSRRRFRLRVGPLVVPLAVQEIVLAIWLMVKGFAEDVVADAGREPNSQLSRQVTGQRSAVALVAVSTGPGRFPGGPATADIVTCHHATSSACWRRAGLGAASLRRNRVMP